MSCGAENEANDLLTSLTAGENFTIPNVNLDDDVYNVPGDNTSGMYQTVTKITNEDLTTKTIDGTGTFDCLMQAFKAHLSQEYDKNRIIGAEYTKAYIALTESAMSGAVQFLLGRDQAFWQAQLAQMQAITARVQLQTAKVQLAALQLEAQTTKATYALTKLKLSTESIGYCTAKFNLENILPVQEKLVQEQYENQRAQTMDTRSDGSTIVGTIGKQKALYSQQITSYQRDAEVKTAKLFTDAWTVQKTIDEGLNPPNGFTNASLDQILTTLKTNNALGT